MFVLVIHCDVTSHIHHLMQSAASMKKHAHIEDNFSLILWNKKPPASVLYPVLSQWSNKTTLAWETWLVFQQRPFSKPLIPIGFLLSSKDHAPLRSRPKGNFTLRLLFCKITLSFKTDWMLKSNFWELHWKSRMKASSSSSHSVGIRTNCAQDVATTSVTVTLLWHVHLMSWRYSDKTKIPSALSCM